jgi:hypothetical protein
VFEQTLPAGTYAVVGFEHVGPTAVAARLIFPGSVHRPGTVAGITLGSRTFQGFYEGLFGIYGHFKTISLPYVEVLTTAADAVNQHEGYLRVCRVGDLDHPGSLGYQASPAQASPGPAAAQVLGSPAPPGLAAGGSAPGLAAAPLHS